MTISSTAFVHSNRWLGVQNFFVRGARGQPSFDHQRAELTQKNGAQKLHKCTAFPAWAI